MKTPARKFIWLFVLIFLISSILFLLYKNSRSLSERFEVNDVDQLFVSPDGEKVGFMVFKNIFDEKIPENRQVILYVGDRKENKFEEMYHGSFRTSGWEWFSDDEILVSSSCGTECQVLYLINVLTEEKNVLQYGVDYTWSPNKKLVFAYNYSGNYGLTVGDKKKNVLLSLAREPGPDTADSWDLIDQTQAVWSPDSQKLALVIKKEGKEEMEILIFEEKDGSFKQIFQKDINDYSENDRLVWGNGKYFNYGRIIVSLLK